MKLFFAKHPKCAVLLADIALALGLEFLLEILNQRSLLGAFSVLWRQPLLFLWAGAVIFATLAFSAMFRHHYFALIFTGLVWLGIGVTNCIMMVVRNSPFCGADLYILSTGFSIAFVYLEVWHFILIGIAVAGLVTGLVFLYRRLPKKHTRAVNGLLQTLTAVGALIALTVCVRLSPSIPAHLTEMKKSAEDYGFVYCFTRSIFDRGIDEPAEYGKETVSSILTLLDDRREETDRTDLPNVIFVQLESFFDVNALPSLGLASDPIPGFTAMKRDCTSGLLTVPGIGGGTANTEFEVLTGMELDYFGTGEFPYDTVLKKKTCESCATVLSSLGLGTHAIHNHEGSFYDRNRVYANLGFDTFTSIEYMNGYPTTALGWCKDTALTGEILKCLDSTASRDFVFAVSVQGHGRYPDEYRLPEGIPQPHCDDPVLEAQFSYYIEQIHEMDVFLTELTAALTKRQEKSIVVFYGDHLPGIDISEEMLAPGRTLYQTDYVIWNNFGAKAEDEDLSSSELGAKVLAAAGIHEGVFNALHQYYRDNEAHSDWMHTLQYDILFGDRLSFGGGDERYGHREMRMGIDPISVSHVVRGTQKILIYGENFTRASVVRVNGWSVDTEYLTPSCLAVHETALHGGETICVAQISGSLSILGQTEEFRVPEEIPEEKE